MARTDLQRAAHALGRARRAFLLGAAPPFLGRFATSRPRGADLGEDGIAAVRVAAVWGRWELLDAELTRLAELRIAVGGDALTVGEAFARLAEEPLREVRDDLGDALGRELPPAALGLARAWALVADDLAAVGAPELVSARSLECARRLLAAGDDPVRDVLAWATRRMGRPARAPLVWHDVVRVLRNPSLDDLFQGRDPWTSLREWRTEWQGGVRGSEGTSTAQASAEVVALGSEEAGFESGASGYLGAWAQRGRRARKIGMSAWPHATEHRFALMALGLWDTLREAGSASLLPLDEGAAALPAALWPSLLAEPLYLARAQHAPSVDVDALRLLALAEAILERLTAAAVLVLDEFQRTRSVAEAVAAAEVHFRRAIGAQIRPELGLLLCRPWGGPGVSAPPDAILAAHALAETLRRDHDVDWWRNPRSAEPMRALWSRSATESLEALVVGFDAAAAEASLRGWLEAKLG